MPIFRAMRFRRGRLAPKALDCAAPSTCSLAKKLPHMRAMILADNEKDRRAALKKLLPMQRKDFIGLFPRDGWLSGHHPPLDPPCTNFCREREELMVESRCSKQRKPKIPEAERD